MVEPKTFEEALAQIPPERQEAVRAWIDMQMFVARELGIDREKWFEYLDWAFKNPFDFSFKEVPDDRDAQFEARAAQSEAARSIGAERRLEGVPKVGEAPPEDAINVGELRLKKPGR